MLELFNWSSDVNELKWITSPPTGAVNQAIDLLTQLGAIAENKITSRGKEMLRLPTHPRIAHLLASPKSSPKERTSSPSPLEKGQCMRLALAIDLDAILEMRDCL